MKKIYLFLVFLISASLSAQITIVKSDIVVSSRKLIQASSSTSHALAANGANMNWNFSNLNDSDGLDTMYFGLPNWYEGHLNFPDANLATKNYSDPNSISYIKITDTEFTFVGSYSYTDSSEDIFRLNSKFMQFPSTYNTSFTQSSMVPGPSLSIGVDPDSTGPIPFIDSIRFNFNRNTSSKIDAWGNITTPLGTYPVLKMTNLDITAQSVDMYTGGNWVSVPKAVLTVLNLPLPEPDSSYNVNFWTNNQNIGFPLVSYNYSPRDTNVSSVDWLQSKPEFSSLKQTTVNAATVYPNPVANVLHVQSEIKLVKVVIYDIQGRVLVSEVLDANMAIDLSELNSGVYQVQLFNSQTNEVIGLHKIMKH